MDTPGFAVTKIQPPRSRGARVPRPRLDAALAAALSDRRVVLLVAPAGFGKSSALAQQLAQRPAGEAVAWLSLDEDDDAPRLFSMLAAALEAFDLPWRTAPAALAAQIAQDAAGLRRAVSELVNALAGADAPHGTIVLDDLHRVTDEAAFRLLDALIERLPPTWTLVLASRVEPPLALARWRAADELAEFTLEDLRFSADEAATLAAVEGAPLTHEGLAGLFERTRGWPAGLRLGLAALRTRRAAIADAPPSAVATLPGAAIDRHLFDYLASEVLDDMPAALHDFLLRSSVLPALTAPRAAAVSGDARAAQWLDEIERRGLFVTTLDAEQRTLVLHDLFRDALEERLRRRWPDELPGLLQRAAAGEADPARRIGFLLRAADWPAAEEALVQSAETLFLNGAAAEVQRLADQFDAAWRERSPRLLRLRGLARSQRWQWHEMVLDLEAAVRAAESAGDAAELQRAQALLCAGWAAVGRNDESRALLDRLRPQALDLPARLLVGTIDCVQHFERGELDRMPATFAAVVDGLEKTDSLLTWWENSPSMAWSTLRGMRPVLERYCAGALLRCGERELPLRAMLHSHQAYAQLWAGRVDSALAEADIAESELRWLACSVDIELNAKVLRMLVNAMQGRTELVALGLEAMYRLEDEATPVERRRIWRHNSALFGVRVCDVMGDAAGLQRWADRLRENLREGVPPAPPKAVPARLAAAQGRWAEAADLYLELLPHTPRLDLMGQCIELQLRAGHALLRVGRRAEAACTIAPALQRMRTEGERGHALMCGPAVLAALAGQAWDTSLTAELHAELREAAALAARVRGSAATTAAAPSATPDVDLLLSSREREVLERIAAGDSNKLIARLLDISPHTVKRHVANILDKLALTSRGQAAAWLREHA